MPGDSSTPGSTEYRYDPTVGMQSLLWDPWTTSLDPALVRDQSADDARSLCFTGAPLDALLDVIGLSNAVLDLQAAALASRNDLGGKQTWNLSRDRMTDGVRLDAGKVERIRIDAQTVLTIRHDYWASVDPARPDLVRMGSTTTARIAQPASSTNLVRAPHRPPLAATWM